MSPPFTFDVVNEASGGRCRQNKRTKVNEPIKRTEWGIPPIDSLTATAAHPTFDVWDEHSGVAVKRGRRTKAKVPPEQSETDSEAERKSVVFDEQRMTRSRAKAATADLKFSTKVKAPMSELDVRTQKSRDEVLANDDPLEGTSTSFDTLSPTQASNPCLTYHHKSPRQGLPSQSRTCRLMTVKCVPPLRSQSLYGQALPSQSSTCPAKAGVNAREPRTPHRINVGVISQGRRPGLAEDQYMPTGATCSEQSCPDPIPEAISAETEAAPNLETAPVDAPEGHTEIAEQERLQLLELVATAKRTVARRPIGSNDITLNPERIKRANLLLEGYLTDNPQTDIGTLTAATYVAGMYILQTERVCQTNRKEPGNSKRVRRILQVRKKVAWVDQELRRQREGTRPTIRQRWIQKLLRGKANAKSLKTVQPQKLAGKVGSGNSSTGR